MNNNARTVLRLIMLVSGLSLSAFVAADMSGSWAFTVELPQGSGNPSVELVEKDGQLSGTYTGMMGSMPVTGKVENDSFTFSYNVEAQGMELTIEYNGNINEDQSVSGTMKMGDFGEASFTGKKK